MTKRRLGLAIVGLALALVSTDAHGQASGANHHQRISAGFMGCMPAEVELASLERDNGVETWIARCRGVMFSCVWVRGAPTASGGGFAQCAELRRSH
ncbi:hypothetical protein [Sandaracinus amylolyticus]|uniref:hypothetical protein n=1 Tax=Sandaracinus amylolyticus TaxID=927083 RepID=UPI001F1F25FD|nr:hypothetical protein [Sandaracinus amylolyticus]UJR84993.1 Hypothetical protein I5071_70720 [Sandaracinus amylolyticus]